jgi:hypothetical protein
MDVEDPLHDVVPAAKRGDSTRARRFGINFRTEPGSLAWASLQAAAVRWRATLDVTAAPVRAWLGTVPDGRLSGLLEALPLLLDLSRADEIPEDALELRLLSRTETTLVQQLANPHRPVDGPEDPQDVGAFDAQGGPPGRPDGALRRAS